MRVIRVVQLPNSTVFSRPFPSPLSPATQQPTTPLISLTDSSESTPSSVHQELTPADLSSEATAGKSSLALRFVRFTRLPAPPPSRSRVSSSRSWSKDRVLRYYGILRVGSGFHSRVVRPSSYVFLLRRRTRALILSHRMTSPSPRASLTTGTSEPPSFGCNGSLKSCTLFSTAATYVPSGIRLVQSLGQRPPPHPSTTTTTIRITTPTPQTTPPALSPSLSPCSSAGSTESSPADYIWDGPGLYVLDDDQHRHFSSSNPGERDPRHLFHNRDPPSAYNPLRTSPSHHRLSLTACDTRHQGHEENDGCLPPRSIHLQGRLLAPRGEHRVKGEAGVFPVAPRL